MKSVRLDPDLEARLQEAAKVAGVPESTLMREAIAERCDAVLKQRLDHRLADVIGIIESDGGRARQTGAAFTALVRRRRGSR